MRSDLRLRLREITKSLSTSKIHVPAVPAVPSPAARIAVQPAGTGFYRQKGKQNQSGTGGTGGYRSKGEVSEERYRGEAVSTPVTASATSWPVDAKDWQAFFDERAGIMEFDGGLDRDEAERRALAETIAALGPKPFLH